MASLGATLTLVLAASLALAAVSTVVAFQGWPGVQMNHTHDKAEVLAAVAPASSAERASAKGSPSLTVPHRAPAPPRPAHHAAPTVAPHRVATVSSVAPSRGTSGRVSVQAHPAAQAANVASAVPPANKNASTGKPAYKPGDPVRKVGNDLGGTVAGAGKGLGDTVSKVSPALGETVTKVTQAVGQVVAGATDAVGKVLDDLTHPPEQK